MLCTSRQLPDRDGENDFKILFEAKLATACSPSKHNSRTATAGTLYIGDNKLFGRANVPLKGPNVLRGVKNHRFFPLVYRSSRIFLTFFLASSRWLTSLKVSLETEPLRPSSSRV